MSKSLQRINNAIKALIPKAYLFHMLDQRNRFMKNEIFKKQQADIALRSAFSRSILKPGDLCFDIGANLGNRIDGFLNAGAKVVALEPQKFCCDYLKLRFGNKIELVNKAVGAEPGESDLFESDSHTLTSLSLEYIDTVGNTRFKKAKWKRSRKVEVTTLKALIQRYGMPTFIKIDVEGYELEVLKGLDCPIPFISFEYNTPEMKDLVFACVQRLYDLDQEVEFNYSIGESMEFASKDWWNFTDFNQLIRSSAFLDTGFGDVYARMGSAKLNQS